MALQPFIDDPQCQGGAIALSRGEPRRQELKAQVPARFELIDGGDTRAQSVVNGLVALAARADGGDWVLVHDAARPCLSAADLARLVEQGAEGQGALLPFPWPIPSSRRRPELPASRHVAQRRSRASHCGWPRRRRCFISVLCAGRSSRH